MPSSISSSEPVPARGFLLRDVARPLLVALLVLLLVEAHGRWTLGGIEPSLGIRNVKSAEGYREVVSRKELTTLVLGDSRFETAVDPVTFEGMGAGRDRVANLAISSGSVTREMEMLIELGCTGRTLILLASPGTVLVWQGGVPPGKSHASWYDRIESELTAAAQASLLISLGQPAFFYAVGLRKTLNIPQPNGWIRVMTRRSTDVIDRSIEASWQERFGEVAADNPGSLARFESALAALQSLHNQIVVVRNPIHPVMRDVEDAHFADFDGQIDAIAGRHGVRYLPEASFPLTEGITYDGVHYDSRRAAQFSRLLAARLAER